MNPGRIGLRISLVAGVLAAWLSGCALPERSSSSQPPDFQRWIAHAAQAVWHNAGDTEVVVDLHWWLDGAGSCRLEVSKAGLPFLSVMIDPRHWEVTGMDGRRRAGRQPLPSRAGWLQLAQALASGTVQTPWTWQVTAPGRYRLDHAGGKERWDVVLTP